MYFLMLQKNLASLLDFWIFLLFCFLIQSFLSFAYFFQVFTEPGKVVSRSFKSDWYILVRIVDDLS